MVGSLASCSFWMVALSFVNARMRERWRDFSLTSLGSPTSCISFMVALTSIFLPIERFSNGSRVDLLYHMRNWEAHNVFAIITASTVAH